MPGYTSYDVVGAKEDVSDIISNISPTKTPFQSSIGLETVVNKLYEWQEDELRAVTDNAQIEGFTASATARVPTVMRQNYTQILSETFQVTGTNDAIAKYGRATETAYEAAKTAKALKRDLEHAFVGTANSAVAGGNSTARKMAGYQAQIDSDQITDTGGAGTVPTEAHILDRMQDLYDAGAEADTISVTSTNARTVADFAKTASSLRERSMVTGTKGEARLVNVIEVYVTPYGSASIILNRFQRSIDTLIYSTDMWSKVVLKGRNWFTETLAKTGDNVTKMLVGEFSLKHKNQNGSALIRQQA